MCLHMKFEDGSSAIICGGGTNFTPGSSAHAKALVMPMYSGDSCLRLLDQRAHPRTGCSVGWPWTPRDTRINRGDRMNYLKTTALFIWGAFCVSLGVGIDLLGYAAHKFSRRAFQIGNRLIDSALTYSEFED
jgi:hypothetical protein